MIGIVPFPRLKGETVIEEQKTDKQKRGRLRITLLLLPKSVHRDPQRIGRQERTQMFPRDDPLQFGALHFL